MIPFIRRDTQLKELMDDPLCDKVKLQRTYRQFRWINRMVASWDRIFTKEVLRSVGPPGTLTMLDVGCGLMDNAAYLNELAGRYGYRLQVTGIDPSNVVAEMMENRRLPEGFTYRQCYLQEIRKNGESFDLVISNHLLHHLSEPELSEFLNDLQRVTSGIALMNDLRRNVISWAGFGLATLPVRWYSFLSIDGMRSIRRSYRPDEIRQLLVSLPSHNGHWSVETVFPFRMVVKYTADGGFRD